MSAPPPFSGNCVYGEDPMDKDRPASRMRLKEKRIRSIFGYNWVGVSGQSRSRRTWNECKELLGYDQS
jgi:hypothetical protein